MVKNPGVTSRIDPGQCNKFVYREQVDAWCNM
jgi:hypothetical protein